MCTWHVHMSILINPSTHVFFPPSPSTLIPNFLPILGKKLFSGSHISFPSPPPNQTFSKKKNFFLIFFFGSTLPTIHSTKHIFNVELFATKYSKLFWLLGLGKKPASVLHVETKMPLIFIYSTFNFPPIQFQPICFDTFCFVLLFSQHFRCYHKYVKCLAS